MYNWSVDTKRMKKDKDAYLKWHLEQLINYGLGNDKIDKKLLKKYFDKLSIDEKKKSYLKFIV